MRRRRPRRPLLALVALLAALAVGYGVRAVQGDRPAGTGGPGSGAVVGPATPLSALPVQVAETVKLVQQGGPFPYPGSDGEVFHNAERRLPAEPVGFYREYTVPTPGESTRGARRLIAGRDGRFYYTGDHYESFVAVDVTR